MNTNNNDRILLPMLIWIQISNSCNGHPTQKVSDVSPKMPHQIWFDSTAPHLSRYLLNQSNQIKVTIGISQIRQINDNIIIKLWCVHSRMELKCTWCYCFVRKSIAVFKPGRGRVHGAKWEIVERQRKWWADLDFRDVKYGRHQLRASVSVFVDSQFKKG